MCQMRVRQSAEIVCAKMKQHRNAIGLLSTFLLFLLRFIPSENEQLSTKLAPPPVSLASNGSKVFDNYRGNLALRDFIPSNSEISFILYYAPWSADSIDAFREFEAAAEVMYKQVSFVSTNCWWNQGECRREFHFQQFPQIYLHHKHLKRFLHYNGPLLKDHFLYFLKKVLMPLEYLRNKQQVENFLAKYQFTVLSAFEPSLLDNSGMFRNYFRVALTHLENNLLPIQFGVITDLKVAKSYHLKSGIFQVRNKMKPNEIILLNLKDSIENISKSLEKLMNELVMPDLYLPGTKTNFLQQTMLNGPTVITFVSSKRVEEREELVRKLRQLVILCYNCKEKDQVTSQAIYANSDTGSCCKTVLFKDNHPDRPPLVCSICVKPRNKEENYYAYCNYIENYIYNIDVNAKNFISLAQEAAMDNPDSSACAGVPIVYNSMKTHLNACCMAETAFFQQNSTEKSENFQDIYTDEMQSHINSSESKNLSLIFTDNVISNSTDNIISGLFCKTNRTLQFLSLDYQQHMALSRNLGVGHHVYHVGCLELAAVIFDPKTDKRHVLSSSSFNIENFVVNYTLGILPQNYQTASESDSSCVTSSPSHVCVHEVTSSTFEEKVLNNDKDVLLLYYGPWCQSCMSIYHVYLSLAGLLRSTSNVYISRINIQTNDLPLPFTMESIPTVVFFPANRSSYSSVFPRDREITSTNLLSFMLEHMSKASVKQVLLSLCVYGSDHPVIQHAACKKWKSFRRKERE